jgi:acetyl esterase/lipase
MRVFVTTLSIIIGFSLAISGCTQTQPTTNPAPTQLLPTKTNIPATVTPSSEPTLTPISPTNTPTIIPSPTVTSLPFQIIKDISYVPDGFFEQKLDIYLPTNEKGPFPTIIMVHSGGGRKEELAYWGRYFAELNYAAISINHRDMPEYNYPDHIADAFCSLAWLHTHSSEYAFDPNSIFAMGHSNGGTIAAMLGVVDDAAIYLRDCPYSLPDGKWVSGVIPFGGVFNYASIAENSVNMRDYCHDLFGGDIDEKPEKWSQGSPITWIDGSEPPFLIIHGAADHTISPNQSKELDQVLRNAGVAVDLFIVPNANHAQVTKSENVIQLVLDFMNSHK